MLLLTLRYTGLRLKELVNLRTDEVDPEVRPDQGDIKGFVQRGWRPVVRARAELDQAVSQLRISRVLVASVMSVPTVQVVLPATCSRSGRSSAASL